MRTPILDGITKLAWGASTINQVQKAKSVAPSFLERIFKAKKPTSAAMRMMSEPYGIYNLSAAQRWGDAPITKTLLQRWSMPFVPASSMRRWVR